MSRSSSTTGEPAIPALFLPFHPHPNTCSDQFPPTSLSHNSRFGEEFQEFDVIEFNDFSGGRIRYANESGYRKNIDQGKDTILREAFVSALTIGEIKRVVRESEVMETDPSNWPDVTYEGSQRLVIRMESEGFTCRVSFDFVEEEGRQEWPLY